MDFLSCHRVNEQISDSETFPVDESRIGGGVGMCWGCGNQH